MAPESPCVCFNLRRASRSVSQTYDGFLQASGLRTTQFSLLGYLIARGPLSITRLSDLLGMDRTTLTRNLRPLERQGFIEVGSGANRRTRQVMVTEAGRAAYAAAKPLWQQAQAHVLSRLPPEHWQQLRQLLDTVSRA